MFEPTPRGKIEILMGPPGSGKTTLGLAISKIPQLGPLHWWDFDHSLARIWPLVKSAKMNPFDKLMRNPESPQQLFEDIGAIKSGTMVFDTMTEVEQLLISPIKAKNGVSSIEEVEYGKGPAALNSSMRDFITSIRGASQRGVNTVLLCHTFTSHVKLPTGVEYNAFFPAITSVAGPNKKGSTSSPQETLTAACDAVRLVMIDLTAEKNIATAKGTRTVISKYDPATSTKSTPELPDYKLKGMFDEGFWKAAWNLEEETPI